MRDVQIILYCDPCLDEGDKTEAEEEREVAVDGVVRLIAVCAEHRKPVALVAGWLALGLDPGTGTGRGAAAQGAETAQGPEPRWDVHLRPV
jgi:hypothetical protein